MNSIFGKEQLKGSNGSEQRQNTEQQLRTGLKIY
jgi:hypothetical protein